MVCWQLKLRNNHRRCLHLVRIASGNLTGTAWLSQWPDPSGPRVMTCALSTDLGTTVCVAAIRIAISWSMYPVLPPVPPDASGECIAKKPEPPSLTIVRGSRKWWQTPFSNWILLYTVPLDSGTWGRSMRLRTCNTILFLVFLHSQQIYITVWDTMPWPPSFQKQIIFEEDAKKIQPLKQKRLIRST